MAPDSSNCRKNQTVILQYLWRQTHSLLVSTEKISDLQEQEGRLRSPLDDLLYPLMAAENYETGTRK